MRRCRNGFAVIGTGLVVFGSVIAQVSAGETTIKPSVTVSLSYSDNIDQERGSEKDGAFVTAVTPAVEIRSEGARVELALDASPTFYHQTDGDDEGMNSAVQGAGFGNVEAVEQLLFLDAKTSVSQELLDAAQSNTEGNRRTVYAYGFSPYLVNRFGNYANSELRYLFDQVIVDEESDQSYSNDTTHTGRWTVGSEESFPNLKWDFNASGSHTSRSSDTNISRADSGLELEYVVQPIFSLLGGAGYQYFNDRDDRNDVDGPTWNVGFLLHSPRGELRATFGRRDDNESFDINARYRIGAWTTIAGSYAEFLETGQERIRRNLSNIDQDSDTGGLIDDSTGLPFEPNTERTTSLANETTRTKRVTFRTDFARGRNRLGFAGSFVDQDDQTGPDDEQQYTAELFWERRLWRNLTARISGRYERSEFDIADRNDDEYIANALVSYSIRQNLNAFLSYTFDKQDSDFRASSFEENRVTGGFRFAF